jgi:hypothetical protein
MATAQEIQYIISARDEATKVFKQLGIEGTQSAKDINAAFDLATNTISKHNAEIQKTTSFYKTHRAEMRQQSFYMRGMRESINALSFGFLAFMGSQDDASESTKKMNKGLMEGFGAFQGLNLLMSGMGAGPWGIVAAGAAGAAIAILEIGKNTEDVKKKQEELNKVAKDYYEGIGGQFARDALAKNVRILEALEKEKKNYESLLKMAREHFGFLNEAYKNQVQGVNGRMTAEAMAILKEKKDTDDIIEAYKRKNKAIDGVIESYKPYKDQLDVIIAAEKQAAAVEIRKKGVKIEENLAKGLTDTFVWSYYFGKGADKTLDAIKSQLNAFRKDTDKMFGGGPNAEENAQYKEAESLYASISQMKQKAFRKDENYEMQILDDWHAKALADSERFYVNMEEVNQIYQARKSDIEDAAAQQRSNQYITFANDSLNALKTIFGDSKAAAIAQATINTYEAATKALTLPFPLNWIEEALVIAAGLANVASITKQDFAFGTPPGGFTVPSGYPNDRYPIGVSSGEKVNVTPAGKGSNNGGNSFVINIPTTLGKQELIALLKGLVRDTGQTIATLSQDRSGNVSFANN